MKKDDFDPYNTLGVSANAGTDEIKKAFKERAKETHPDKGGSAEEFDKVGKAYRLLTDQRAREKYDKTGSTDDKVENTIANAVNMLGIRFTMVIAVPGADREDIIRLIRKSLEKDLDDNNKTMNTAKTQIQLIEKIQKRIRKKRKTDLHDFVKEAYNDLIRDHKKKIGHAEDEVATVKKALELLSDYECLPPESELYSDGGLLPTGYQKFKPAPKNWNLT